MDPVDAIKHRGWKLSIILCEYCEIVREVTKNPTQPPLIHVEHIATSYVKSVTS